MSIQRCNIFIGRINACKLLDIGHVGPKYTWRGPISHDGQLIYEKLYRALSNNLWRLKFLDAYVKILTRVDFFVHRHILITPVDVSHMVAPRKIEFESA